MADTSKDYQELTEYLSGARYKPGKKLTGKERSAFESLIQYEDSKKGYGKTISRGEILAAQKEYNKTKDFGDYFTALTGTFKASQFGKKATKELKNRGYEIRGGYFQKSGPITRNVVDQALEQGFSAGDVRGALAQQFAANELDKSISGFMKGGDYKKDPSTGKWSQIDLPGSTPPKKPSIEELIGQQNKGPYAGLDPNSMPGSTIAEMEYASRIDPYKIQAKTAERQTLMGEQGAALRTLAETKSAERRARLEAEKDIRTAKISQGSNLYNLIPYAFT